MLEVQDIIVLGHYGCGGVKAAATREFDHGLIEHWIGNIREVVSPYTCICLHEVDIQESRRVGGDLGRRGQVSENCGAQHQVRPLSDLSSLTRTQGAVS